MVGRRAGRWSAVGVVAGLLGSMVSGEARAEDAKPATLTTPRSLRYDLTLDVALTAGLGTVALVAAVGDERLMPARCRVCDATGGTKAGLDGTVRDALVRQDPQPARVASDVVAFGVAPVLTLSLETVAAMADGRGAEAPLDALLVAEATSAAMVVDGVLGVALAREKPRYASLDAEAREAAEGDASRLGSLPASHVSLVFALGTSAGTVASLRGYRLAPLVWGAGMGAGALTAYLRVAGDEAWLTDTLLGAGVGTAIGAVVPLVFHRPRTERPSWITAAVKPFVVGVRGGQVVGLGGVF